MCEKVPCSQVQENGSVEPWPSTTLKWRISLAIKSTIFCDDSSTLGGSWGTLPNQGRQRSLLYSAQAIGVSLVLFWVLCLQMTQQGSCPATISELLFTQLAGYSPNIFPPLRNDLRLFGKLPHVACSLSSHFHGSTRSSTFSQLLHMRKTIDEP